MRQLNIYVLKLLYKNLSPGAWSNSALKKYSIQSFTTYLAAPSATVDDGPFAAFAYPNCHGFHQPAAGGCSVAGFLVNMQAAKTVRAMVAVGTACALRNNDAAAVFAGEHFAAGVCFVISFFKAFAFVFTVHG